MTTKKEKVSRRKSDPGTLTFRPVQEKTTIAAELPWGASKIVPISVIDYNLPTGVFVGQSLLLELFSTFEKKIQAVTEDEPMEKLFNKSLQRGGDVVLDNLCRSLNTISELCLPSVLDALLKWHKRMETSITEKIQAASENKPILVKKLLAINYLLCIVLIEILNQLEFHLNTCELYVKQILDLAFKHMQYKDPSVLGQNHNNSLVVAETYAEVIGVISDTRFPLIHRHFVNTLTELKKETSPIAQQQVIALLMAMKFLKIKSNQVDDLEIGIKFLDDLAGFFLEVKDKDVKHAAAGLLVEILLPIASLITRETNVPALINFVGRLYNPTSELASKKQHKLAAYPLLTCLLCVSQRTFFLANWGTFLTNALASLKNRDSRISRVALESLYRLLWVYMIRNHSDRDTRTRLESICGSLFPKGNRNIVPRDAPLNIFVKIIHFIAQQKLDFAFKDVIFDLLCCNRTNRTIYPERMNIGLRALMVIADGLQQKDDPPAMPKSMGPSASGTMQRIKKKTYITRPLTVEIARALGLDQYYVPCRKAFDSILRTLDSQVGKPMMLTVVQKGKDVEELLGGDVKPKLDLFRTCVAAIPRLLPEPMSHTELIEIITRLTIHMDEELRNLAGLTLQTMLNEFPDWRESVITCLIQLIHTHITDFYPAVLDDSLRLLLTLIGAWKQNAISEKKKEKPVDGPIPLYVLNYAATLHAVEGLALVMFCQKRLQPRKIAISLIKEVKNLIGILNLDNCDALVINVLDEASPYVVKKYMDHVPQTDRLTWPSDFIAVADRIGMIELDNSLVSIDRGNEYLQWDPWACALSGYSEKQFLLARCPTAVASAWPMLFSRLISVNAHVDPNNPQNESRASLLRGSKSKTSSIYGEALSQEECLSLWSKYMVLTCAFAPPSVNTASLASRSFSPTSSVEADVLRSVSSSLRGFRAVNNTMSLSQLLLKVSSMLRWENMTDIRDSVVLGIGSLNPLAFDSLLDELNQRQILREAQEKKVETNIRRKKRKDLLRLQLIRLFEVAAWRGVLQSNLIDSSGHLNPLLLDFIDTMRINLEVDQDRDVIILTSLRLHFAKLVALVVESVPPSARGHLIPDDSKKSLFYLFIAWCSRTIAGDRRLRENDVGSYLEQKAVLAMTRLLCCGPIFEANKSIGEDGYLYGWLDKLVASSNHTMQIEVEEMLALMLDLNESSFLVDWLINQCYSQNADVSARCFRALVRAFSRRDFPCEFVSLFVLCQAMSADPDIVDVAVHMMELLKKQFLDANSTICSPIATGSPQVALRGAPTPSFSPSNGHCYPVEQETVCRNLAKLYPHLTITVFSEVSCRLESAMLQNRGHLLSLLLPWIENMELVDATAGEDSFEGPRGWGSEEATQLLLNNLMHLTAAFSTDHEHHIAALWKALAVSFPANLPTILNYLYALIVLSHDTLLPHAKRICVFLSGAVGNRLASLLLEQLTTSADQSKLTLERVEIAPYYRWKDDSEKRDFTNDCLINALTQRQDETQQEGVRLLPMPAYGGHYSSLSQFLPSASQSIQFFTRSQVALLLVCDLIRSSGDVDWTEATPRLLHSGVLNLDSLRPVLCRHARKIIINVCMLYADASTYSQVSAILLKNQMSLTTTEPFLKDVASLRSTSGREIRGESPTFSRVAEEEYRQMLLHSNALFSSHSDLIKAVVFCLSENMDQPLWPNEDATSRNWKVTSANQLSCLVRHLAAELFLGPLPLLPVVWTQTAMRMALATPQRHLAGRCFQIVSSLCQSPCAWIPSLISRLVETAGEQHEETQAYVTDLLVCLLNSASTLSGVLPEPPPLPCASPTHTRSTSYTPALLRQSMMNQRIQNDRKDARLSLLVAEEQPWTATAALVRSKSAEQLKTDTEGDDEATARVQMCAIAVSLLESNLENEFNLALNLLEKILGTAGVHKVPCVQKLEKTIQQLEWKSFTNIVSLVVRGAIVPMAIEPSLQVQIQLLELLNEPVIGGKDSFSLIICHMLPYLLLNFESPTQLCTEISSSVARYCKSEMEKAEIRTVDHPFNHLATVMIQYSTKTFTKDRWQWTKCVIQYVCEGLEKSAVTPMLIYLAEILDRGPPAMASYILHMIYLLVNQRDPSEPPLPVNAQVARVVSRHVQGSNWREASRVYKAIVEQWQNAERDKKDDPSTATEQPSFELDIDQIYGDGKSPASPRKNVADSSLKRQPPPYVRVRDRLVALLSASGLRVGLPSAQSVVFSQSELGSASSSTERICPSSQELASTNSLPDPSVTDSFPRVFKEFDFLEAEHDSVSETAESCFGWLSTMRPTSLGEARKDVDVDVDDDEDSESAQANSESGGAESRLSRTSQCSSEERTPCPSETDELEEDINEEEEEDGFDGLSMPMEESTQRQSAISPQTASSIGFIKRSTQDLGLEEASVDGSSIVGGTRSVEYYPNQPAPLPLIVQCSHHCDSKVDMQWTNLINEVPDDNDGDMTAFAILLATQMFRTSCSRVLTLLRDASVIFGAKPLSRALISAQDTLARMADCPFIFVTAQFLRGSGLMQRLKYSLYEMREHVETFNERKEQCIRMLNSVRSAYKLTALCGSTASLNGQNETDLAKLLSKTFFQLMQMNDALHHMLQLLEEAPSSQLYSLSPAVLDHHRELLQNMPDSHSGELMAARSDFNGDSLVLLMANKRYSQALQTVRQLRLSLDGEFGCCDQTDIDVLLLLFCRSHTLKAWALVGAAADAMRRQSDLLRDANADLATATASRRLTVEQTPQRTVSSVSSSLNESFSKLSYHPDM